MEERVKRFTLSNGTRVLAEPVSTVRSAACGIWVAAGSSHEPEQHSGVAHVIEHMMFKGTPARNAQQIAREIEGRGGSLNAGTGREVTGYYAHTLSEHLTDAFDVLADMFANALYDPEELAREKGVILEEMKMYEDSPGDAVHDIFAETHWPDDPFGRRIIGTPDTVSPLSREDLLAFMESQYAPESVVITASGNLDPDHFAEEVEKRLGSWKPGATALRTDRPSVAGTGEQKIVHRDVEQVSFCMGCDAPSELDERKYDLAILANILGGSMFSRLWTEIRERRGLAYEVGAYTLTGAHKGALVIYGGCATDCFAEVKRLVQAELDNIAAQPVSESELDDAKNLLKGALLIGLESTPARMSRLGRLELTYGRTIPMEEIVQRIDAVTPKSLHALASEILSPNKLTLTAIVPNGS